MLSNPDLWKRQEDVDDDYYKRMIAVGEKENPHKHGKGGINDDHDNYETALGKL
jgi:hypothetical protein